MSVPYLGPAVQRSEMVMAACSGLIRAQLPRLGSQIRIDVRPQGAPRWQGTLFASDSYVGIEAVARREADLAMVNPSALLALAYRGRGRFTTPVPLRVITVMPQRDAVGLAVPAALGYSDLEDLVEDRYPLRLSLRGARPDHSIHVVLHDLMRAAGLSLPQLEEWGGRVEYDHSLGRPIEGRPSPLELIERGEHDAIFDEGVPVWADAALGLGMTFLGLRDETLAQLEDMGYRRSAIERGLYPALDRDVPAVDFSGWPLFTHAETPDAIVEAFCTGIESHLESLPWEASGASSGMGEGPFPLKAMCSGPAEAPLDAPFHPAAQRYWAARGYLD